MGSTGGGQIARTDNHRGRDTTDLCDRRRTRGVSPASRENNNARKSVLTSLVRVASIKALNPSRDVAQAAKSTWLLHTKSLKKRGDPIFSLVFKRLCVEPRADKSPTAHEGGTWAFRASKLCESATAVNRGGGQTMLFRLPTHLQTGALHPGGNFQQCLLTFLFSLCFGHTTGH